LYSPSLKPNYKPSSPQSPSIRRLSLESLRQISEGIITEKRNSNPLDYLKSNTKENSLFNQADFPKSISEDSPFRRDTR